MFQTHIVTAPSSLFSSGGWGLDNHNPPTMNRLIYHLSTPPPLRLSPSDLSAIVLITQISRSFLCTFLQTIRFSHKLETRNGNRLTDRSYIMPIYPQVVNRLRVFLIFSILFAKDCTYVCMNFIGQSRLSINDSCHTY